MAGNRNKRRELLRRQLARWLRVRREGYGLSQRQLGSDSERYPWSFDPTWVSHWERNGPREGFLKGLAYLDLLEADVDLMLDLLRAPLEPPGDDVALDQASIEPLCRRYVNAGELNRGLGLALAALDRRESEDCGPDRAGLLLILGILAKRSELYSLSAWAAESALAASRSGQGDRLLAARAAILAATVQTWVGYHFEAMRLLDAVPDDMRKDDAALDAETLHARGFAHLEAGRFAEASLDYKQAADRYPSPRKEKLLPVLHCCFALAKAKKGHTREALRVIEEGLTLADPIRDRFLRASIQQTAGYALLVCRRPSEAIELLKKAEGFWKETGLDLRLLETRLLLLAAARSAGSSALAEIVERTLRAPLQRRRIPERLRRLRLHVELHYPPL